MIKNLYAIKRNGWWLVKDKQDKEFEECIYPCLYELFDEFCEKNNTTYFLIKFILSDEHIDDSDIHLRYIKKDRSFALYSCERGDVHFSGWMTDNMLVEGKDLWIKYLK